MFVLPPVASAELFSGIEETVTTPPTASDYADKLEEARYIKVAFVLAVTETLIQLSIQLKDYASAKSRATNLYLIGSGLRGNSGLAGIANKLIELQPAISSQLVRVVQQVNNDSQKGEALKLLGEMEYPPDEVTLQLLIDSLSFTPVESDTGSRYSADALTRIITRNPNSYREKIIEKLLSLLSVDMAAKTQTAYDTFKFRRVPADYAYEILWKVNSTSGGVNSTN